MFVRIYIDILLFLQRQRNASILNSQFISFVHKRTKHIHTFRTEFRDSFYNANTFERQKKENEV